MCFLFWTLFPLFFYLRNSVPSSLQDWYFPSSFIAHLSVHSPFSLPGTLPDRQISKSMFGYMLCYSLSDLVCLFFSIFIIFPQLEYKILEGWPWILCYFVLNMLEYAVFVWSNHVECRNNLENITVNVEWAKKCWRPDTVFKCQKQWPLKMNSKLYQV